jgi:RIO-like serine/threonine protein kinase
VDAKDITLLRIVDGLWETYDWVPVGEIEDRLSWKMGLRKKISDLERQNLILWSKAKYDEPAVQITEKGLDTLAVWDFRRHGVIDDIGNIVGKGKEAVVVLGMKDGEKRIIKFHRYYSAGFRNIKRSLSFALISWWKKKIGREARPLDVSRAKAQIEYKCLCELHGKVNVPKPYGINRHAIVMEFLGDEVPAPLLNRVGPAPALKEEILDNYMRAVENDIVHGDLSPFNVMVWNKPYLIDWPQAVPKNFETAAELMKHDIKSIEDFFRG